MCVRPPVASIRPSGGVFLFAVGPMTAIEISDLIRFEEKRRRRERGKERASGTHNAEAFFIGRDQLWSGGAGLDSGAKQGVKRSSIRGGANAEGAERMSRRKNERRLFSPLTCRRSVRRSFWRSRFVRLDQKMRSNRRRARRERAGQFPSSALGGHGAAGAGELA